MTRIHIQGGRLVDPVNKVDWAADLFIDQGRVVAVGDAPKGFTAERIIDASNKVVCPGFIDLRSRLWGRHHAHQISLQSESIAAARNGFTTVCCSPDSSQPLDKPASAERLQQQVTGYGNIRLLPLGALTRNLQGEQLAEMGLLKKAGCVAFTNGYHPIQDTAVLRHCFEYAASCDVPVFLQPLDVHLAGDGCVHEGAVSTRLGLKGIPATAETVAVARDLFLVEATGVRAHFSKLSTAGAVELVADAQARGLPVTADVTVHHLYLTELDLNNYNSQCHVMPPLRSKYDRDQLRHGVVMGVINAICSDHQPLHANAKLAPFPSTLPGASAVDTVLPLVLGLQRELEWTLSQALASMTVNPARCLGIDAGHLSVGSVADVCVFDPEAEWHVSPKSLHSHGHNTPFMDKLLKGRVTGTVAAGKVVFD